MKHPLSAIALVLAVGLSACGKADDAAPGETPAAPGAMSGETMGPNMDHAGMTGEGMMAHATGRVTAVDPVAGTITLDHSPIPEANWPAMTMTFEAPPEVTQSARVGDDVAFDVRLGGGAGEVTAIRKP